jgi:intraflagellar transport protein 56
MCIEHTAGIALAATGQWAEALEAFLTVSSEKFRREPAYACWLARCYINVGQAREAWELYVKMDTSTESVNLLVQIANDCYKVGSFYFAAKAFDLLEKLDGNPEFWEGKRGACAGVVQLVLASKLKKECLRDVYSMLRTNAGNPQAELMLRGAVLFVN